MFIKLLLPVFALLLIIAPTSVGAANTPASTQNVTTTTWQRVTTDSFTLSLPPTWKFNELQGIDSYVGEFVGNGARLFFDFGRYSYSLAAEGDQNHTISYQTIDGHRAKIVTPKVVGKGTTGVYFDDLGNNNRLTLYENDLTADQQATALKIFSSVVFLHKMMEVKAPTYFLVCTDQTGGTPVITSLSSYSGSTGTKLEISGCNFAGFEGDQDVWIKNNLGVKGLLVANASSTSKLLKVTLKSRLCQQNTSYSGLPCSAWLTLAPGKYQIYATSFAKKSNEVTFSVTPVVKKKVFKK